MHMKRLVLGFAVLAVGLTLVFAAAPALADDELPRSLAQAIAMEAKDALPLTEFYEPPKPFIAAPPQANDVLYSIPAARTAVPALGRPWVAIGHSQGGVAVWGVAELARYHEVTTKGCWYYAYAVAAEVGPRPAARAGWDQAPEVRRYNADSRSANKPIKGPLMVLAGDDDHSVAIANIEKGVRDACRLALPIEFRHRPGLDHDPLMEKTIGEQLAWTRERLDGKPWVGNCPR